jgi:uncharacterized membrane protein YfcA
LDEVATGLLGDTRFLIIVVAAMLAGLVRGFSGFGAAMVFVPLASLAYEPKLAVVWLFVMDNIASLPMLRPAFRTWPWREVLPLCIGAAVGTPVGVYLLASTDAEILRWLLCGGILITVGLMLAGFRLTGNLPWHGNVAVGGLSGLGAGAMGLSGPPVVLLWLNGTRSAATARANIVAYFALLTIAVSASLILSGLITSARVVEGLLLVPAYGLPLLVGMWAFPRTSDRHFRTAALVLCGFAALAGLPLWRHQ